jgi:hypothetical protein
MSNKSSPFSGTAMAGFLACCGLILGALALYGAETPVTVNWQTLKTLNSSASGLKSPALQLQGKRVSIPGFMVPLEDDEDVVTEFLLVPYAGACIHVPPPPPNQIVYVKMSQNAKVKMSFTDPIIVTGQLKISTVQSPYGDVSYNLTAESVKPYGAP